MMYPENMQPSDVIEASWLEEYEKQQKAIWWQLLKLNNNLFLIERIEEFPFAVFLPYPEIRTFWSLAKNALIETSIMTIWRVILDTDSKSLTLKHFKNQVLHHLRNDEIKQQLRKSLKNSNFKNKISELEERVIGIRNNHFAHLNKEMNTNPLTQRVIEYHIDIVEMKNILSAATEIFDILCFNSGFYLWYSAYSDSHREKRETDIDRLLDSVARGSDILNFPDENPGLWEIAKPDYPENWITTINEYRRKFGMKEA